jgi:penicillin-binding protein 1C
MGGIPFSDAYFSRDGELLKIYPAGDDQYRLRTGLSRFPPLFISLLLLQEDEYFYYHPGVNPVSLTRAFYETYIRKSRRIGGSTLTMQVARLRYGLDTKNIAGKIRQILIAFYLEALYSKNEILSAYVNLAPCGGNIQGFAAASEIFFGKPIGDLSFSEWVLLCVLPQDPLGRDPRLRDNGQEILRARNRLYDRWERANPGREETVYYRDLLPAVGTSPPFAAPHFTEMLRSEFRNRGAAETTLDGGMQRMASDCLDGYVDRLRQKGVKNGSLLILDYRSMEIRALVGSADFFDDSLQGMVNGTVSRRSPGSTLKPFIYGLALDQGLIHPETVLFDRPISFSTYAPDNYQRDFKGPVPAWSALVNSRNIPAVELASRLKNPDLYGFLKKAPVGDLKEYSHYGLSLVLGSAEFSMLELVGLYAALGNGGELRDITAGPNMVIQDFKEGAVLSAEAAFIIRKILERNPAPGEGLVLSEEKFKRMAGPRVAYKTGTSIGFKDAWSIGLYGPYVIAVWIGNFDGRGNPAFLGRETAAPLLFEIAGNLDPSPDGRSYSPSIMKNVEEVEVCAVSGCLPTELCRHRIKSLFIPGISPIKKCDIHRKIIIDEETGLRTDRDGENTKQVIREIWPSDMLALFREAGMPRPVPPPYEQSLSDRTLKGRHLPPQIISPMGEAVYIQRLGEVERKGIPLTASADGEAKEVFWFANGNFIGRATPQQTIMWYPDAGNYDVILLDDKGLSSDRAVTVELEPY